MAMHINIHYHILVFLLYSFNFSVKCIMQGHCRRYSANRTLGEKKRWLLSPKLSTETLLDSDPALVLSPVGLESSVGLYANPEKSSLAVRPEQSYKSKPLICSLSLGKSFIPSRMQVIEHLHNNILPPRDIGRSECWKVGKSSESLW